MPSLESSQNGRPQRRHRSQRCGPPHPCTSPTSPSCTVARTSPPPCTCRTAVMQARIAARPWLNSLVAAHYWTWVCRHRRHAHPDCRRPWLNSLIAALKHGLHTWLPACLDPLSTTVWLLHIFSSERDNVLSCFDAFDSL